MTAYVETERIRAVVRLISPDHITPMGARQIERVLLEVEESEKARERFLTEPVVSIPCPYVGCDLNFVHSHTQGNVSFSPAETEDPKDDPYWDEQNKQQRRMDG
jgi:hypothetical protein